eukprot:m.288325 g.288325  ORF g.288325 m.288325 type:complete len:58 (+) comp15801_c1_seq3:167-340(+)
MDDLMKLGQRQRELEMELAELDKQIFKYEGTYLSDSEYGNAVAGWSMAPKATRLPSW